MTEVITEIAAADIAHEISQVSSDASRMTTSCNQVKNSSDTLDSLAKGLNRIVG